MSNITAESDFFTDKEVLLDPYGYFEKIREHGPVYRMPGRDVVIVTGFEEGVSVLLNSNDFSSIINPEPLAPLTFEPKGEDISAQIAAARPVNPALELLVTYDGDRHTAARHLLNPVFKPSRLKANEAFMRDYAEEMVREVVAKGSCELIGEVATPYVTMVIADLLGVPEEDRARFREVIDAGPPPGNMDTADQDQQAPKGSQALMFMAGYFFQYLTERRANPRDDLMTELANATYPDGSIAELGEAVKSAMFLFAAGQDTSAKLLGNAMRFLCERQDIQQQLREDRTLILDFIEEMMRVEGSTKATFRLSKRRTKIGDVEIPAGQRVVIALPAANRDPRRWDSPQEFRLGRPKIKEHIGFGRGAHTCVGAPLARVEVAAILNKFLDHTRSFDLAEAQHGPRDNRTVKYEASYIIRGIESLYVEFEAA
ncbi:MAG: cytochrome P450 [Novosphingobium sp.]